MSDYSCQRCGNKPNDPIHDPAAGGHCWVAMPDYIDEEEKVEWKTETYMGMAVEVKTDQHGNVWRRLPKESTMSDSVNHPSHYNAYKGVEVIDITERMNFNLGNAVKYIARAGLKDPDRELEDLQKALWYVKRELMTNMSTVESNVPLILLENLVRQMPYFRGLVVWHLGAAGRIGNDDRMDLDLAVEYLENAIKYVQIDARHREDEARKELDEHLATLKKGLVGEGVENVALVPKDSLFKAYHDRGDCLDGCPFPHRDGYGMSKEDWATVKQAANDPRPMQVVECKAVSQDTCPHIHYHNAN